jgi:DNA-binding transcriptional regulator YhcF (GntR family)
VKALQKLLGVGQSSVESAKQQLERRGLIETRQRSGSYLLADAKDKIASEEKTSLGSAQMLDFYLPRAESKTVSIYTMDCLGRSRNAWEAVIAEFQAANTWRWASHGFDQETLDRSCPHNPRNDRRDWKQRIL